MRRALPYALSTAALCMLVPSLSAQPRVGAVAVATTTAPRTIPAGSYQFTNTEDDGDVSAGTVQWIGQQMRIDMEPKADRGRTNRRTGAATGNVSSSRSRDDYILVDFTTNTVRSVKPDQREISELPLATFEQIIGKALGMVGSVVQMQVRDAGIVANDVGAGGEIAGLPTRQYRIVEEYTVRIGVFGMNAEEKHHRVVTEYWVPTGPGVPRNPVVELMMRGASATAQQDATHQRNLARTRSALFTGVPIKAIISVTEAGEQTKRSSVEITSLSVQSPSAALFVVPSGYTIRKNDKNNLNFSL
jgi:hypothetical protein